jgi:hypothetical protein
MLFVPIPILRPGTYRRLLNNLKPFQYIKSTELQAKRLAPQLLCGDHQMSKKENPAALTVNPSRGIAAMLSRKEFFRDLLLIGIRAVNDLAAEVECASAEPVAERPGFDLPATELSPSLLAIEAELRGIDLPAGNSKGLQQEIYQKMAQHPQNHQGLVTKGG